jgi:hypothetical protein
MRGLIEATACACLAIARQLFAVLRQGWLGVQERIMAAVSRPFLVRYRRPDESGNPQRATALKRRCLAMLPRSGGGNPEECDALYALRR